MKRYNGIEEDPEGVYVLYDEVRRVLENSEDRRESLAQEIREGLKIRGLWTPTQVPDLITAIFQAIDEARTKREGIDKEMLKVMEEQEEKCALCPWKDNCLIPVDEYYDTPEYTTCPFATTHWAKRRDHENTT
jgi:hypothetical protein